jgi:hypothetical protein
LNVPTVAVSPEFFNGNLLGYFPHFQVTLNGETLDVEKGCITHLEGNPLFADFLTANSR